MTKKVLQLGFCLAIAALAAFTIPARAIDFSYTQNGIGGTMAEACDNAVQRIADYCDDYGAITTDPVFCRTIFNVQGQPIGKVCVCKATATFCRINNF